MKNSAQLNETKENLTRLQREYETYRRTSTEREQLLSDDLKIEQIRSTKLQKQLVDSISATEHNEAKGQMYNQVKTALDKAEKELSQLQDKYMTSTHTVRVLTEERYYNYFYFISFLSPPSPTPLPPLLSFIDKYTGTNKTKPFLKIHNY